MDQKTKFAIIENYRELFFKHGEGPEVGQWSEEGQRFRFEKLSEISDLSDRKILDLGCGLGDLYPFLKHKYGRIEYTGIDIVPEIITRAQEIHSDARFFCRDVLTEGIGEMFDFVVISGMFNNPIPDGSAFLRKMSALAFEHCEIGLAFNFISNHVNFRDKEMQYHDPVEIFGHCLELTTKVSIHHHYNRCDVAVFAYR